MYKNLNVRNFASSSVVLFLILSNHSFKKSQASSKTRRSKVPSLPSGHLIPPARSVADIDEEYWITNKCAYPPLSFYSTYREACDVKDKAGTFLSDICQAFFNSSKAICTLEGATEEERETMLNIHEEMSKMGNEELCDDLAELKADEPDIFPSHATKEELPKWYEMIYSIVFTPDMCSSACAMRNAHPICFGYLLNYRFISSLKSHPVEDETEDDDSNNLDPTTQSDDEAEEENKKPEEGKSHNKGGLIAFIVVVVIILTAGGALLATRHLQKTKRHNYSKKSDDFGNPIAFSGDKYAYGNL